MMDSADEITGPINLGNPGEFTVAELASMVIDLTGSRSRIVHMRCRSTIRASDAPISTGRKSSSAGGLTQRFATASGGRSPISTKRLAPKMPCRSGGSRDNQRPCNRWRRLYRQPYRGAEGLESLAWGAGRVSLFEAKCAAAGAGLGGLDLRRTTFQPRWLAEEPTTTN
jgi:hypothetical protein